MKHTRIIRTETYPNKQSLLSSQINFILLTVVTWAFYFGCSQDPSSENISTSQMKTTYSNEEQTYHAKNDYSETKKQRRMGIYHYNEGNKFLQKKEPLKAISNYKMALHHTPDFLEASINLTTAYLQGKRFNEALKTLKTLQEKNPNNPLLFYNLACYYALTAQTDPSLEALKKALALGYKNLKGIKSDPDLENLRKDPKFANWRRSFSPD